MRAWDRKTSEEENCRPQREQVEKKKKRFCENIADANHPPALSLSLSQSSDCNRYYCYYYYYRNPAIASTFLPFSTDSFHQQLAPFDVISSILSLSLCLPPFEILVRNALNGALDRSVFGDSEKSETQFCRNTAEHDAVAIAEGFAAPLMRPDLMGRRKCAFPVEREFSPLLAVETRAVTSSSFCPLPIIYVN